MVLITAVVLLLLSIGSASPITSSGWELHETKSHAARSLQRRSSSVDPNAIIPIKIGLTQSNLDRGYSELMDVSHPASPDYGKHLSTSEVNHLFAPSGDSVDVVRKWLGEVSDVDKSKILLSINRGWLAVDLPVHDAERAFSTHYYEYEDRNGHLRIGCDAYYLPRHVRPHVDYVTPGVRSSPILKKQTVKRSSPTWGPGPGKRPPHWDPHHHGPWHIPPGAQGLPSDLQDCGRNITPVCIRALYGIPMAHLNDSLNSLGLYEGGDYYAQADLDSFFTQYAANVPNGTAPIPAFIDGAQAPVLPGDPTNTGESDMYVYCRLPSHMIHVLILPVCLSDLDMAFSLIYPQTVTLYQTDDQPQAALELEGSLEGFLNTFLDAVDGSYCNYTYDGLSGDSPGLDPIYPDPLPGKPASPSDNLFERHSLTQRSNASRQPSSSQAGAWTGLCSHHSLAAL